jgi:hypothetical protein
MCSGREKFRENSRKGRDGDLRGAREMDGGSEMRERERKG